MPTEVGSSSATDPSSATTDSTHGSSPASAASSARVGVLALQGAFARHVEALNRCGVEAFEVRNLEHLNRCDAVVLPGGESTTMNLLLDRSGLRGPLAERLAVGIPVLATCAGMILLATQIADGRPDQEPFQALDIDVRRNGYGRQINSFESNIEVKGLNGGPFRAVFIRAPVVTRYGFGVEVLAEVDGKPVLCRQGAVLATSFHPELTDDYRLHQMFVDSL